MNATSFVEKNHNQMESVEMDVPEKKLKKSGNYKNLLVMTAVSLLIMFTAVGLIYYFIKTDPDIIHANDQTSEVSENPGYVNPNSIQKLEHDDSNISVKPAENSDVFIICGAAFMVVIVGAFIYAKVAESKEDD